MCPSGASCLSVDSYFCELSTIKIQLSVAGSSDKIIQPKNDSAKLWFKLAQSFQRGVQLLTVYRWMMDA
jgi:hypothetical protein